jgi:uncharacterized membrane protein YcaP (DUF421 family)
METVLRAVAIYLLLLIVFRISGKRSLAQITTFDFVLLLIIGEAVQQALLGEDFSLTNAILVIITLVSMDIGISLIKQRSKSAEKIIDSVPIMLIENGQMHKDRMDKERVDESEILSTGREQQGIERLDQIKYAILEHNGHITIIPKEQKQ